MQEYKIIEGLSRKSLDYLVQPILSIDEYESKISDKRSIVIGFYCGDNDPANDLSHFIDKSSQPILDTDISPAPTPEGYYVVWVEILRDNKFPQVLLDLLGEVDNLTNVKDWQFQCPNHKDPIDLNKDALEKNIILDQSEIIDVPDTDPGPDEEEPVPEPSSKQDSHDDSIKEFWMHAVVDKVIMEGSIVTICRYNDALSFVVSKDIPHDVDMLNESATGRYIQKLLGPAYNVYSSGNGFVLESGDTVLFVSPIG